MLLCVCVFVCVCVCVCEILFHVFEIISVMRETEFSEKVSCEANTENVVSLGQVVKA